MSVNKKVSRHEKSEDKKTALPESWLKSQTAIRPLRQSAIPLPGWAGVLILIIATAGLNSVGIKWGLPENTPWNSDSIAGLKTVQMMPRLFKSWRMQDAGGNLLVDKEGNPVIERYPRAQFIITGMLYKPFIKHWEKEPFHYRDSRTGRTYADWRSTDRISTLILISRIVTVIMAAGAVVGVFAATRLLCRDSLVGFLAAMVLMLSAEFTYFSHLGNLDTPVTFWFIWTAYWLVKGMQKPLLRYFVLAGIFAGLVVCTKDASYGHLAGVGLFTIGTAACYYWRKYHSAAGLARVLLDQRLWAGAICFAIVFLIMNNVLTDYAAFTARVRHWMSIKYDYFNPQLMLFVRAVGCVLQDCGLAMFVALMLSLLYCAWKYPTRALWAVSAFLAFHIIVTIGALQVQPRYHLPSLTVLGAVFGLAGRDLLEAKRIPAVLRYLPLVVVVILAGMFSAAIDAEMVNESRYRAEAWIRDNVNKQTDVITFISPRTYMPRSANEGYKVRYAHKWRGTTAESIKDRPKLIAMSDMWYLDPIHFDQEFREKLLAEKMGYRMIAEFGPRFTPPAKSIFSPALYLMRVRKVLSPEIVFMERVD
ncbi:MAG: glycosyltransferase family 39 protein [Planctomycetota bacterium]